MIKSLPKATVPTLISSLIKNPDEQVAHQDFLRLMDKPKTPIADILGNGFKTAEYVQGGIDQWTS